MSRPAIKWGRATDGYVDSKCGLWKITPCYWGRTRPVWFQLERLIVDVGGKRWKVMSTTCGSQREAKELAEHLLNGG